MITINATTNNNAIPNMTPNTIPTTDATETDPKRLFKIISSGLTEMPLKVNSYMSVVSLKKLYRSETIKCGVKTV